MKYLVIFLGGVLTEYIEIAMKRTTREDWEYFCEGLHGNIVGQLNREYDNFLDHNLLLRVICSKIKGDYGDEIIDHMYTTFHSNGRSDLGHEIALIPETSSNSMLLVSKCFMIGEANAFELSEFI